MKLKELAEIRSGLKFPESKIQKGPCVLGPFFQYLRPEDLEAKQSNNFISEKDLRKAGTLSRSVILTYGDYILYRSPNGIKLLRYESTSGYTIPDERLVILRLNLNIIEEFFGYEENRKYFLKLIQGINELNERLPSVEEIGEIEIMTNNILELRDANRAEIIGIRKPITVDGLPFNILQKPITIDKLLKRISHNELLLDTEFQRRPGLWDIGVKSRFIESMIIRLPVPAFYFDGSNDDEWLVIDGLQRLSAVHDFVGGKYGLVQLDYLPELEKLDFNGLSRSFQRNIEEYEVYAYILQKGTPKAVTYKIFKNINTSALKLEPQEIRHAINPGPPANILKTIVEQEWFKEAIQISDRMRDRMEDREVALRFLAFQRTSYRDFRPTIVEFLDTAMNELYEVPEYLQNSYIQTLKTALSNIYFVFNAFPFSRSYFDEERKNYTHSNIIFELLTYCFAKISKDRNNLKVFADEIKHQTTQYFKSKQGRFWEYDNAYSQEGLIKRFEEFERLLINVVK